MLYHSDLKALLSQWEGRLTDKKFDVSYKDAMADCIYDLQKVLDRNAEEQMTEEDALNYLLGQEADSILAAMKEYGTA